METFTALSYHLGDINVLCDELIEQVSSNVVFGEHTLGVLICDSSLDCPSLIKKLSETYAFDIIGVTANAFIKRQTEEEVSASLTIMTGNKAVFHSYALSEPMTESNMSSAIENTYKQALQGLESEPVLILAFTPFMEFLSMDDMLKVIDNASGCKPIYGAVASSDIETELSRIFVNGQCYENRVLLALLGGDIKPLFALSNVKVDSFPKPSTVTKSEKNIVYTVANSTFLEFMKKNGLPIMSKADLNSPISVYASSPVMVGTKDSVPKVRVIVALNHDDGSVVLSGPVEEGAEISIGVLLKEDILDTAKDCVADLIKKIESNSTETYQYSTLFSTSCGARYLVMMGDTSLEGEYIKGHPAVQKMSICGYYAMGEICPVAIDDNGKAVNRAHTFTIALMAF